MAKIPVTSGGMTEEQAIEAGKLLREGWDLLRGLQFNKKASILRYTETVEAKPHLGIPAQTQLVSGLADVDVYASRVSTREVLASRGVIEMTDMLFVFYAEVRETDQIEYEGKTYQVIQIKHWDRDIGRCAVVGRMI
jgi:hypothetical protein